MSEPSLDELLAEWRKKATAAAEALVRLRMGVEKRIRNKPLAKEDTMDLLDELKMRLREH